MFGMITKESIQAGSLNELQSRTCKLVKDGESNFINRVFKLRNGNQFIHRESAVWLQKSIKNLGLNGPKPKNMNL